MIQLKVTNINFDLDPGDDSIPQEHQDILQKELKGEFVNTIWHVLDEEDLVNEITCETGWCINSIDYVEV